MAITDTVKDILSVKIKPRQDGYSDQFSRILMVKIMLISAVLVGLNWYSDKIICIIPSALAIDKDFVSSSCWINGLYVYEKIRYHVNDIGYYGMPKEIELDGMDANGRVCSTRHNGKAVSGCEKLEKTFYLQYQYMTFFLLAMSALYYAPYAIFRKVNEDMVSLKASLKDDSADTIVITYFNHRVNPKRTLQFRILGVFVVKFLYIVTAVLAFLITDSVLNGRFKDFGSLWIDWSKLANTVAYDYMGTRHFPKPGNELLPSYGFCEVRESARDIKHTVTNKHKFICEMSQHILYQYVFIILWFAMVFSIVISVIGFFAMMIDMSGACFLKAGPRTLYRKLTLRECQYLEFLQKKKMPLYGEVIKKLASAAECNGGLPKSENYKDGNIHMNDVYKT